MIETLGVDMWGTIRRLDTESVMPGAFSTLRHLVGKRFGERIWLISAAQTGEGFLQWLNRQNFYKRTGILREHVKFCGLEEKSQVYTKLGATHIIDDSDVILMRAKSVKHRYLFHADDEGSSKIIMPKDQLGGIQIVTSWQEVLEVLLSTG